MVSVGSILRCHFVYRLVALLNREITIDSGLGNSARSPLHRPQSYYPYCWPQHNWLGDCNENQESKKRLAWRYTGVKF